MNYSIESDSLQVQVRLKGMELSSIRSKTTQQEYLWQGDSRYWTGQAPVLFPIIGALKGGKTTHLGQEYALPKHGFVRNSDQVQLVQQQSDQLVFRMESNSNSLAVYPFVFALEVKFQLFGKCLEISHKVYNLDDKDMYYSIGGHPAFNCPLLPGEKLEDYLIEFPEKETDSTWMIAAEGLIGEKGEMVLNGTKEIPLHAHLFDHDALIFKQLKSREVSLSHRQRGPVVKLEFEDFNYLGIWAKSGAPFVCLEPWLGIADSVHHSGLLAEKVGIRILSPGATETKTFRIWIEE
ncbi:aldose 1-epimerase family protein [Algoriphagus sp. A40]|uniref:aldose 1-epimerase family protein n=1 Tax=Algoriphagus sp. A40 TaxID=1945863 RepID=UPI00098670BD|nr:aldose 1-epimerase family protein [Algoriphagus sp. A40]OOG76361.1 hypothetical protein B0E43_07650 [Algoriphagus sp. A40]